MLPNLGIPLPGHVSVTALLNQDGNGQKSRSANRTGHGSIRAAVGSSLACTASWGLRFKQTYPTLNLPVPHALLARGLQPSRPISKASFFSVISFHMKTLQELPTAAAKTPFFKFLKTNKGFFFLRRKGDGRLEFPGASQQELCVGPVPLRGASSRPGPAH